MTAVSLRTDHPGIRVLAEVAQILAQGMATPDTLGSICATLRRGLGLTRCRLWCRAPDGGGFVPITAPGDTPELADAPPIAAWVAKGPATEHGPGGTVMRLPLIHEEEPLGALEAILPSGPGEGLAHDVMLTAARILAPYIAATELSQDL